MWCGHVSSFPEGVAVHWGCGGGGGGHSASEQQPPPLFSWSTGLAPFPHIVTTSTTCAQCLQHVHLVHPMSTACTQAVNKCWPEGFWQVASRLFMWAIFRFLFFLWKMCESGLRQLGQWAHPHIRPHVKNEQGKEHPGGGGVPFPTWTAWRGQGSPGGGGCCGFGACLNSPF